MSDTTPRTRPGASTAVRVRSPGDVLRDDHMHPRAMTVMELAHRAGLPVVCIRGVLTGEPIGALCAARFATVFSTTALYWVLLQTEFDMACEQRKYGPGGLGVL
ncbi:hypothetical protein DyAD56_14115 [Dyella sp. AD56]|uniref:helix-turn-helix transcriptional regulator n=1 Tax=Dyella sp. AD56 TaxID=1528744 RepID=UPI000C866F93|nr:hypothetical protein [Dyella sp. AD56]PMQ04529.1 hypothetical protein DyAD56_14115 [Dyella sp. AD56]